MFFATARVDQPTTPRQAEIDAILADEMLDAEPEDNVARYSRAVADLMQNPELALIRRAVGAA